MGVDADHYDIVIVGGGSAGCVLASRLSEDPTRRVLLLEAGPDFAALHDTPDEVRFGSYSEANVTSTDYLWHWDARNNTTGTSYDLVTGKLIGGGSSVNGQVWLRGLQDDFDDWASGGLDQWAWSAVEPFFCSVENDLDYGHEPFHGASGPISVRRFPREEWADPQLAFAAACVEHGFIYSADLNAPGAVGYGAQPFNNVNGVRLSTALTFLARARSRPNLTVLGRQEVRRIDLRGSRAVGVVSTDASGATIHHHGSEVVLCAGAIGSARLLMMSGIGNTEDLRAVGVDPIVHLPGVGARLDEHPLLPLHWPVSHDVHLDPTAPRYQLCLRTTAEGSDIANDLKISMSSYSQNVRGEVGVSMAVALELTERTGSLKLTPGSGGRQLDIDFRFLEAATDRSRMRYGVRLAVSIARSASFATLLGADGPVSDRPLEADDDLDAWMLRTASGSAHPSSTCPMGLASDDLAVTDQFGRVHGVDGLRVVDASIFPRVIRANLNATVIMAAEKIASTF